MYILMPFLIGEKTDIGRPIFQFFSLAAFMEMFDICLLHINSVILSAYIKG